MNSQEIERVVLGVLADVAPDADLATIDATADLQQQLDLDSFDFLNVVVGLSERLGVKVPEQDYTQVATLDGCVAYLADRLRAAAPS